MALCIFDGLEVAPADEVLVPRFSDGTDAYEAGQPFSVVAAHRSDFPRTIYMRVWGISNANWAESRAGNWAADNGFALSNWVWVNPGYFTSPPKSIVWVAAVDVAVI